MLVARAFGCDGMYYSGDEDDKLKITLEKICTNWGGNFFLEYVRDPMDIVTRWKTNHGRIIHLTMYGENIVRLEDKIRRLYQKYNLMVIVGSSKVPSIYYKIADINVAIGHQPHSEIAALAILLDRIHLGNELKIEFQNAKLRIIEQKHSKKIAIAK
ncbi:MAG: tRNA (cytidine(56)-2'-O)-methyltransferase [Conexivisphaerales archaeon]